MNKATSLLVVALAVSFMMVGPAAAKEYKHVVSTNALNLAVRTFSAEYEHVLDPLNPKISVYTSFRYGSLKIGDFDTSWPGVSVGLRIYPKRTAPTGFHWGPLLYWNRMTTTFKNTTGTWSGYGYSLVTEEDEVTASFIGPMVGCGYRWNWGGFVLAPSGQVGFLMGELKSDLFDEELSYGGFAWGLGLSVGSTF